MDKIRVGTGSLESALKRVGTKSDILCLGNDQDTGSGIVVAKGKIRSSRILDIKITPDEENHINTVIVRYVDKDDNQVKDLTFAVLDESTLATLIGYLTDFDEFEKNISKMTEIVENIDEKVENIDEKVEKNDQQIVTIENDFVSNIKQYRGYLNEYNTIIIKQTENGEQMAIPINIIDPESYLSFKKQIISRIMRIEEHLRHMERSHPIIL